MATGVRRYLFVAAALLWLAACGRGDVGSEGYDGSYLSDDISPFQQAILEDGAVSFAEYERSVFATVECLESRGATVVGPFLVSDAEEHGIGTYYAGEYDKSQIYNYILQGETEAALDEIVQIKAECSDEFLAIVELVYLDSIRRTEPEMDAYYERLSECLRDGGVAVPANADRASLDQLAVQHMRMRCG